MQLPTKLSKICSIRFFLFQVPSPPILHRARLQFANEMLIAIHDKLSGIYIRVNQTGLSHVKLHSTFDSVFRLPASATWNTVFQAATSDVFTFSEQTLRAAGVSFLRRFTSWSMRGSCEYSLLELGKKRISCPITARSCCDDLGHLFVRAQQH